MCVRMYVRSHVVVLWVGCDVPRIGLLDRLVIDHRSEDN